MNHSVVVAALSLAGLLRVASGQCQPVYGTTGGIPGVGNGYAGPSIVGNLVITGSFITIGPAVTRGVATLERCCPCRADYNLDGGVDGMDLEAFFVEFVDGLPAADVNCDGGTDGPDIESFITSWQRREC